MMMETEKILHLRRYVTLLQTGVRLRVARSHLHTRGTVNSPCGGGYVPRCVQRSDQAHLRFKNYATAYARTFGTSIAQPSVDDVDQRLMLLSNDVKKGQVTADELKEVLKLCEDPSHHSTSMLLLKCCGNLSTDLDMSARQNLIDQVWNLISRNSKEMTLDHYNALLQIHVANSSSVNPTKFLTNMTVEPDENTYCLLLNTAAKVGNSKYLNDIMSVIEKKNILFNEDTFNMLVNIYVNNNNIAEAERMITRMQDVKFSTAKAYTELACGYAKLGDIPNLIKILNDEQQSDTDLLRITKVLSLSNNNQHIPTVLNFLKTPIWENEARISQTIMELTRANQITGAFTITNFFILNKVTTDVVRNFINTFLLELIMIKTPVADITKYAINFMDSGCEPLALTNVAEIGLKLGRENLCYATFDAMRDKNMKLLPHYYWPLLIMARYKNGEAKIFSVLQSMKKAGVELDFDTLFNYVYPYINTVLPHNTLQRMLMEKIRTSVTFMPLVAFLLSKTRLQDAIMLCEHMYPKINYKDLMKHLIYAYIHTKDAQSCVTLLMNPHGQPFIAMFLKMLIIDKSSHMTDLELVLEEFARRDAKISRQNFQYLNTILTKSTFFAKDEKMRISNLIESLVDEQLVEISTISVPINSKYMNNMDLECLLIELQHKNMYTGNILFKLFEVYCNENNLKKVELIKHELDKCKQKWTYSMKVSLLELYINHDKLNKANTLITEINNEFQINTAKVLMFAIALVKADKPLKAFEIIEQISADSKNNMQNQCCLLLNTLAHSKHHSHTKNMMKLLVKKKYCIINVELLKPLMMIPLERNDIKQAMNTFVRCIKTYNKMPLAMDLLIALLQSRDSKDSIDSYISKIYKLIIDVHGIEMANTILVMALASLNKTQEMQSIMQKQKLSINIIVCHANQLQSIGKLDALVRIFENISDKMDQIVLCDVLIKIYSKMGNYQKALELWKKMCAKNVKFSQQSKENFSQLLLLNRIPLPPEFERDDEQNLNSDDKY